MMIKKSPIAPLTKYNITPSYEKKMNVKIDVSELFDQQHTLNPFFKEILNMKKKKELSVI